MPAPAVKAYRTQLTTGSSASVEPPSGLALGDTLVAIVQTANQTVTWPAGWTEVEAIGVGSAGSSSSPRLSVAIRQVTTSDSGDWWLDLDTTGFDHAFIVYVLLDGCVVDVSDAASYAASYIGHAPGVTTTQADALVLAITGHAVDVNWTVYEGWTNGDLSSFGKVVEYTRPEGVGGGIGLFSGGKASAGSVGASTLTMYDASETNIPSVGVTVALVEPPASVFPAVESSTLSITSTNRTSHSVALPATVNAGDVLVVATAWDGPPTITWDNSTAGTWTAQANQARSTYCRLVVYSKIADGTEGGKTLTLTSSASEQMAARVFRISGAHGDVEAASYAPGSNSASADPPSLTPAWGEADTLWLAVSAIDGAITATAAPTDYTDLTSDASSAFGLATLATARRDQRAASENPAGFTLSGSTPWAAATIAVRPAAGGGGSSKPLTTGQSGVALGAAGAAARSRRLAAGSAGLALAAAGTLRRRRRLDGGVTGVTLTPSGQVRRVRPLADGASGVAFGVAGEIGHGPQTKPLSGGVAAVAFGASGRIENDWEPVSHGGGGYAPRRREREPERVQEIVAEARAILPAAQEIAPPRVAQRMDDLLARIEDERRASEREIKALAALIREVKRRRDEEDDDEALIALAA